MHHKRKLRICIFGFALAALTIYASAERPPESSALVIRVEPLGLSPESKVGVALLYSGESLRLIEITATYEITLPPDAVGGLLAESRGEAEKVRVSAKKISEVNPTGITGEGEKVALVFGGEGPSIRAFRR